MDDSIICETKIGDVDKLHAEDICRAIGMILENLWDKGYRIKDLDNPGWVLLNVIYYPYSDEFGFFCTEEERWN